MTVGDEKREGVLNSYSGDPFLSPLNVVPSVLDQEFTLLDPRPKSIGYAAMNNAPNEHIGSEREVPSLPATDRGRQAWSFVAAGFAIETLLWGQLFSTGVFLKHYSATEVSFGGFREETVCFT